MGHSARWVAPAAVFGPCNLKAMRSLLKVNVACETQRPPCQDQRLGCPEYTTVLDLQRYQVYQSGAVLVNQTTSRRYFPAILQRQLETLNNGSPRPPELPCRGPSLRTAGRSQISRRFMIPPSLKRNTVEEPTSLCVKRTRRAGSLSQTDEDPSILSIRNLIRRKGIRKQEP